MTTVLVVDDERHVVDLVRMDLEKEDFGPGLAIIRVSAAAHGGSAHAENVAPHGTRVSVVLPRIPPAR